MKTWTTNRSERPSGISSTSWPTGSRTTSGTGQATGFNAIARTHPGHGTRDLTGREPVTLVAAASGKCSLRGSEVYWALLAYHDGRTEIRCPRGKYCLGDCPYLKDGADNSTENINKETSL